MITIERVLALIDKMIDDERRWFMEACEQGEEPSASGAVVVMKLELLKQQVQDLIKEPTSEDLERCVVEQMEADGDVDDFVRRGIDDIASKYAQLGTQWQKEQFEKNRLAHCDAQTEEEAEIETDFVMGIIENGHRQPTFDDAIKYGMSLQKEKMKKDAMECHIDYYDGPILNFTQKQLDDALETNGAKVGDKVKVIIIKE